MDLSSKTDGGQGQADNIPDQESKPPIEYTAQVTSPIVSGEVKLSVRANALAMTAQFAAAEIPYAKMTTLALADYVITVKTNDGDYVFYRMGQWAQPFYDALYEAYNKAVLRSMFIKSSPILTANGDYRCSENGAAVGVSAPIHIYENCIAALPPNMSARRVPLCFISGMEKGDYSLTLSLDADESYTFSKLGYDTAPFADAVEKQIRALHEKSLSSVKDIDASLSVARSMQIARMALEGTAAPIGQLAAIAPSFAVALEEKLNNTRASDSYKVFKELCDPAKIYIGFRKNSATTQDGAEASADTPDISGPGIGSPEGESTEAAEADAYLLWLIAPSPDGQYAAVEFAEADSATFVYRTGGNFDGFACKLNRALEAISFKREVIRLTDDELLKPENVDYLMAAERTAALQFIRANFVGRVIHSNMGSWKRKLTELWSGVQTTQSNNISADTSPVRNSAGFCGQCGAELVAGDKFCRNCGNKIS